MIELQNSNLITPSIARSYPVHSSNPESMILHSSYRKIQQKRITDLSKEIDLLKGRNISFCSETLFQNKERLKRKVQFLKSKFRPDSVKKAKSRFKTRKKRESNKKSRERYRTRRYREKLRDFIDNEASITVYNLSSIDIPLEDLFALELGHGFVPAPSSSRLLLINSYLRKER